MDEDRSSWDDALFNEFYCGREMSSDVFKRHVQDIYHLVLELLYKYGSLRMDSSYSWEEGMKAWGNLQDVRNTL